MVFISVGLPTDTLYGYGFDYDRQCPSMYKIEFPFSLFLEEFQALRQIALVVFGASGDLSPSGN